MVGGLFKARGWIPDGQEGEGTVSKWFRKAEMAAMFSFVDVGNYLGETDEVTSDQMGFFWLQWKAVPLPEVPPLVFSEAMRDVDLAVSVAQLHEAEQGAVWSSESYQRRAELVTALAGDLGLNNVRCEGHFAYVTGKRANYRVHLGAGVVHIEPGNYLCIVPERKDGKRCVGHDYFLPFADAEPMISEIISKIILLNNDDKISDESILRQIGAARHSGDRVETR